jgi:hypothetical protein
MTINALLKKIGGRIGNKIEVNGTLPMERTVPPMIPKNSKIEYTIFTYAEMVPITISIHATSLVFDQSMIAKNEAKAPTINWLEIKMISPASMSIVSIFSIEKTSS